MATSQTTTVPNCRECGDRLEPYLYCGHPDIDPHGKKRWGYNGNNIFCTLRCGFKYGVNAVKRGRE